MPSMKNSNPTGSIRCQVTRIGDGGLLTHSDNRVFDLSPFVKKSVFEAFEFLKAQEKAILGLKASDQALVIPAVVLEIGGHKKTVQLEFRRDPEAVGYGIIWLIIDFSVESYPQSEKLSALQHQIILANEKLEMARKELDRFTYIVSHDLKAPLRGIRNLAIWIEEDMGEALNREISNHLSLMKKQVEKMDGLVEGIVEYSKAGLLTGQPEEIDTGPLLSKLIDFLPNKDQFEVELVGEFPLILSFCPAIEQIFARLIDNASLHHDKEMGKIIIRSRQKSDAWIFEVEDDGPGIAPEFQQRIFEIFQVLSPNLNEGSAGVGLAIVKRLVENIGGQIRVEKCGERGSKFIFSIPKKA